MTFPFDIRLKTVPAAVLGIALISACAVQGQIKIACVGNSITQSNPSGLGYVSRLGVMLGNAYEVSNFGLSGKTLLKNGDDTYWDEPRFRDLFACKPDIITIMLGTNDSKPGNWDAHGHEFAGDLQAMIDTFSTIGTKPYIILVLPPHAGEEKFTIRGSVIRGELIPIILSVAADNGLDVIDVNTPTLDRLYLFPDEVHPGVEGHKLIADAFYEGILNFTTDRHPREKLLWYGDAPEAAGNEIQDKPALFVHPAHDSNANGTAVIVCPGGGYSSLAMDHEGHQVAEWLNENGISAFVLRYRYSPYRHPVPLNDAKRAVRVVRYYADDYGIDTTKIGILGFSAGGHLASTLLTHFDGGDSKSADPIEHMASKPDFGILVYPVITLSGEYAHIGSRNNLLGNNPDQQLVVSLSNQLHVTAQTPPTFMGHGDADMAVPLENSRMFDSALTANGVESELFVDSGKVHGYGLDGLWPEACLEWLLQQQIIPGSSGVLGTKITLQRLELVRKVVIMPRNGGYSRALSPQVYLAGPEGREAVGGRQLLFDIRGKTVTMTGR